MINRENAINDVADRVNKYFRDPESIIYDGFELVHFELTPIQSITAAMMPAILLLEGEDIVEKRSRRDHIGYPLTRKFELLGEVWVHGDDSRAKVISMYRAFRKSALPPSGKLPNGSSIREVQVLGPFAETQEGSIGMRIVLEIIYQDNNL